jgi:hypothetical protein
MGRDGDKTCPGQLDLTFLQAFSYLVKIRKLAGIFGDPGVLDDAFLVDDKGRAFRNSMKAEQVLVQRPICGGNVFIEITEQRKCVPFFCCPGIEGKGTIHANGDNLSVFILQGVDIVSHGAEFFRSPTGEGERYE